MQYVNLGRSNLKVSRLGFGAMGIGDKSWRSWVLNEEAAGPILKRALELGISFIDTCDDYCLGRSKEVLGRLLGSFAPSASTPNDLIVAAAIEKVARRGVRAGPGGACLDAVPAWHDGTQLRRHALRTRG